MLVILGLMSETNFALLDELPIERLIVYPTLFDCFSHLHLFLGNKYSCTKTTLRRDEKAGRPRRYHYNCGEYSSDSQR